MSDLVIFVALVGVLVGAGIAVGMIVAGRIDRVLQARDGAAEEAVDQEQTADEAPSRVADAIEEGPAA